MLPNYPDYEAGQYLFVLQFHFLQVLFITFSIKYIHDLLTCLDSSKKFELGYICLGADITFFLSVKNKILIKTEEPQATKEYTGSILERSQSGEQKESQKKKQRKPTSPYIHPTVSLGP